MFFDDEPHGVFFLIDNYANTSDITVDGYVRIIGVNSK